VESVEKPRPYQKEGKKSDDSFPLGFSSRWYVALALDLDQFVIGTAIAQAHCIVDDLLAMA